jgi:hypothetical protein
VVGLMPDYATGRGTRQDSFKIVLPSIGIHGEL